MVWDVWKWIWRSTRLQVAFDLSTLESEWILIFYVYIVCDELPGFVRVQFWTKSYHLFIRSLNLFYLYVSFAYTLLIKFVAFIKRFSKHNFKFQTSFTTHPRGFVVYTFCLIFNGEGEIDLFISMTLLIWQTQINAGLF